MSKLERQKLSLPTGHDKLLLHSCCAPCSGEVMETLIESGIDFSIFFYNPNIHPVKEYLIRKEENIRFAEKHHIPFIDCDYDTDNWFERTALYAAEHGFSLISSSLGISRWKNMQQINECGHRSASHYAGIHYWDYNWRKHGGAVRMLDISKREEFYQQEYCGCVYSLRDSNRWRMSQGRERIKLGQKFYSNAMDQDS